MARDVEVRLRKKVRKVKRLVLTMIHEAGSGHPGGSLSCVDILTVLFFKVMRHNPKNPAWRDRDRFVLSKGHAAPALYAVLSEAGYFPSGELKRLRKFGSILQGHPDRKLTPGVEVSTGSLGQGLSVACGMALANRLDRRKSRVFVLLGDGECDEGQVWEAAMAAAHFKLENLIAVVDRNGMQIDGPTEKVMSIEPLAAKWKSFGWNVIQVGGHDIRSILQAFEIASEKSLDAMNEDVDEGPDSIERMRQGRIDYERRMLGPNVEELIALRDLGGGLSERGGMLAVEGGLARDKPTVIIAHTHKGLLTKEAFREAVGYHGRAPTKDELKCALSMLEDDN
jgi:transketolase